MLRLDAAALSELPGGGATLIAAQRCGVRSTVDLIVGRGWSDVQLTITGMQIYTRRPPNVSRY